MWSSFSHRKTASTGHDGEVTQSSTFRCVQDVHDHHRFGLVKERLGSKSHIVFLQNGMGMASWRPFWGLG